MHGYLGRLNRGQVETSYEMLVHVGKVVMNLLHVATQSLGQFPEYQPHLGTSRKFKFSRFYLFERQRVREREIAFIHWLTFQMAVMAKAGAMLKSGAHVHG